VRSAFRLLAWVAVALMPASAALAASPSVSPIGDITINAGKTVTVNVVAVDTDNDPITLTLALPAFGVLNAPTTGNGIVVTTMTLSPQAADVGTINASLTANAGGGGDTEAFTVTVAAAGSDQAPVVIAPGSETVTEGQMLTFTVTGADPDSNSTTTLTATGVPTGAQFSTTVGNVISTQGTFTWTPTAGQAGHYDVVFTGSNALTGSNVTHITVLAADNGPITINPIADVTLAEVDSLIIPVSVSDPDSGTVNLTASLPAFATLNPPTTETGLGSLTTTITIKPTAGTAGTYNASVTATTGGETATEAFTITVTAAPANFQTNATMIGNFNAHRKSICFRIRQSDASFDLKKVDRSSVDLHWNGNTLHPSSTKLELCEDEGDDDNCEDCDSLGVEHHDDDAAATVRLSAKGGDDGDCEHGDCNDDDQGDDEDGGDCVEGLRACFATSALMDFFGDTGVEAGLKDATIEGHLTTGETFVATIGAVKVVPPHHGDDHKKSPLTLRVKPNPLNPKADISFTLTQPGRVKIAIYDLRGRLVRTVLDESRAVGAQSVAWNGFDASQRRVASGTYFVHIEAPQGREMRSITVLK
jgi:flagellar hook capping protein FlgD/putative Ig domain-containing protein